MEEEESSCPHLHRWLDRGRRELDAPHLKFKDPIKKRVPLLEQHVHLWYYHSYDGSDGMVCMYQSDDEEESRSQ